MTSESAERRVVRADETLALVGGAVLLPASWLVVVAADHVTLAEARVLDMVNGFPGSIWPIVWLPMQLGTFLATLLVPVVVLRVSRNWRLAAATLLAGQLAFWASKGAKRIVGRGRPSALLTDV